MCSIVMGNGDHKPYTYYIMRPIPGRRKYFHHKGLSGLPVLKPSTEEAIACDIPAVNCLDSVIHIRQIFACGI